MDEKAIALELGDKRVMDFKRNDKTKFFKNGDEDQDAQIQPGRPGIGGSAEEPAAT